MTASAVAEPTTTQRVADAIAAARAARDAGMAYAELAGDDWDKALIDQAIAAFAQTGEPFSANDLRPLLPDVRTSLMGSRFYAASVRREIHKLGGTTSTKKNTHSKDVGLWLGTATAGGPN